MCPVAVDADGVLHADTAFGDYPHRLSSGKRDARNATLSWNPVVGAYAYEVSFGGEPDKLAGRAPYLVLGKFRPKNQ